MSHDFLRQKRNLGGGPARPTDAEARALAEKNNFVRAVKLLGYYGTPAGLSSLRSDAITREPTGAGLLFREYDKKIRDLQLVSAGTRTMAWLDECYGGRRNESSEPTNKRLKRAAACPLQRRLSTARKKPLI